MALFIEGMACSLCGSPIRRKDDIVAFPAFEANTLDPIWPFSDGVFHADCFNRHPLAKLTLERFQQSEDSMRIWPPECAICHRVISDPDQHCTFGHLTDDKENLLHRFNNMQLHKSCFWDWPQSQLVFQLITELRDSGKWGGNALQILLNELSQIHSQK